MNKRDHLNMQHQKKNDGQVQHLEWQGYLKNHKCTHPLQSYQASEHPEYISLVPT